MNTIYRSVWNAALGAWVAVSEVSHRRGRQASSVTAAVCLLALAGLPAGAWAQASGGTAFVAGGGTGGRGGAGNGTGGGGGNIGMYPTSNGSSPSGGSGGAGGNGAAGAGGIGGAVGAAGVTASVGGSPGSGGIPDPDPTYGAGGGGGGGAAVYTSGTSITVMGATTLVGGGGGDGGSGRLAGGGGGGGAGLQGVAANAVVVNNSGLAIVGGNGGNGGIGQWAGGGGGGGDGIVLQGGSATVTNTGTAIGGSGGNGGVATIGGMVGGGGEGGAGLALESSGNSMLNTGALVGGAGGAGGSSAANGIGGAGLRIRGNANSIVNSGTLTGGMGGDGVTRGDAVRVTGSDNSVELQNGSVIDGTLSAFGTGNVLRLAGAATDGTTSLGAATYRGFERYEKIGANTWTLTGTTTELTPWTVLGGTLAIADDSALGNSSGRLTLDAGTLRSTGTTTGTRAITLGAGGTTFEVDLVRTLTLNGTLSGPGSLRKTGAGTLVLGAANNYVGGTAVEAGSLNAAATGALGSGPVSVAANASLLFSGATDASGLTITAAERGAVGNAGFVRFGDTASAGNARLVMNNGAAAEFRDNASAGNAVIENHGGLTNIWSNATAGSARITNFSGGQINLLDDASAGQATFVNESGGLIDIFDRASAGQATVVNNAGGRLRIRSLTAGGISIGSLSGAGDVILGAKALTTGGLNASTEVSGVISGAGGSLVKVGTGTLTLSGANTYTGGTALRQGRLNLGNSQALGTGTLSMDDDTTLGFSADGLTIANAIQLTGSTDPVIDTGAFNATLSGAISGGGFITKQGTGTLTLSGANNYTGATNVAQGTLKAGAANTFSAVSAHSVASGATLDLAGFSQTVASLANSGTVSLAGTTAGTTLTVTGAYVGNGGVLRLGTALNGTGPSDRLVIEGGTASGKTTVQIANLGGLGALTSGSGIEVVTAQNGATTTAQTTKDAFSLANGHVDAGAYEYRLYAADANGAGENWYLRSSAIGAIGAPVPVVTYRAEASLYGALPSQLRQGNLAMLGDLRKRVGDDDVKGGAAAPSASNRRAWARVLSADIDIQQGGAVAPGSKGRLTGFQAGTDLLAMPDWRAGIYVGQLDGDASVRGFASGIQNLGVGRNDLRSQYLGVYGTYSNDSGFYADVVVQSGRHRYTVEPLASQGTSGKGNSLLGSIEVGQAFALGGSGWSIEPQLQLIHQHMDLSNSAIVGAIAQPQADSGWIARAGVRVKGEIATGLGTLQPYGRFNIYRTSSGADVARFVNGATTTDIAAPTGGTSTELAGGFTLALGGSTSLYGEVGKLWSSGGDAKVKSGINGSVGVRVKW
ncbi:autotransporter outer membrane beta-barrel domain-containing protein [Variovorax sp. CAN2819]|uniref:autotransporter outer membrane beta-barrel domain-containing protein n=1 Tax=Variovorax sp. CAN15 TaxID=3046727 RepID=UPI002648EA6F|nr:autotransporter outer membrane beta-barrel domain-containing protein [Variovorax sp. CAN15]MDN6884022.1 autotransporter outer membrane beta-barrel domain-containing protein [Variovorax sp. CAN15]